MKKYLKTMLKSEEGYGTVEMLLLVAGIGLLATGLFKSLTKSLVTDEESTTNQVTGGVNKLVDGWFSEDPLP